MPQTGGGVFKQQLWRLQVQGQGVIRVGFFGGFSPWLADSWLPTVAPHCLPSVHCDVCPTLLFL